LAVTTVNGKRKMKKYASLKIKKFVSKPLFDEKIILAKDPDYPKVSIVTPSYNQAKFLERTILSVLNQNYPNLEYVIIDGGSTDGSVKIIKKYEKYLAYWISEPDKGQADAINKGFKISKGEILAYLNSDDTYCDGVIRRVVDYFNNHLDVYLIYGDYVLIDAEDNIIKYKKEIEFDYNVLLYVFSYIPQPTVFFKRDILTHIGLFDTKLSCAMDCDYWIRVARKYKIKHIPCLLANFRLHRYSKTWNKTTVFRKESLFLRRRYSRMCPKSKIGSVLYFKVLHTIYRIKRIYLKSIQRCYV